MWGLSSWEISITSSRHSPARKSHAASTDVSVTPNGSMNCMYRYGDSSKVGVGSTLSVFSSAGRSEEPAKGAPERATAAEPRPAVLRNRRRLTSTWFMRITPIELESCFVKVGLKVLKDCS